MFQKNPNKTELILFLAKKMTTHNSGFFTADPALDTVSTFFATAVILSELNFL